MPDKRLAPHGNDAARRAHFIVGDPVRGCAAVSIFTFHVGLAALFVTGFEFDGASYYEAYGAIAGEMLENARIGIYAFFALSGYLIARPFAHAYLRGEPGPDLRRYLRRRVLRIVPGLLLVITAALIRFGTLDASAGDVLRLYTLLYVYDLTQPTLQQGVFGHLWTVHAEMGFYVLLPLALIVVAALTGPRLGMRGRFVLLLVLLISAAFASLAFRHAAPHTVAYARWLPSILFAFVPGIALAGMEAFIPLRAVARPRLTRVGVIGLVVVGLLLVLAFAALGQRSPAITGSCAALGTSALIGAALLKQWSGRGAWRILDNKALHWLGERSYSFYLIHVPVIWDLQFRLEGRIDDPKLAFATLFVAAFSLTAGLATLGFHYVERPCMEMNRWPWERRRPTVGGPTQPALGLTAEVGRK